MKTKAKIRIDRKAKLCTLADCPIGLFLYQDTLCFKSEYGDNDGFVHAYIVWSGEYLWGSPNAKTKYEQSQLMVLPLKVIEDVQSN
jgi:hypothetical protein